MDLNAIPVFVAVVRGQSFSAAARALEMPISTVSTRISQLEKDLQTTLLTRTTRQLHLTEAGESFYNYAQKALQELENAETSASASQDKGEGLIRVTSTVEMGSSSLSEALADFLMAHPGISIELILTDRLVDIVRERIDVGIRIGELDDSSLLSKRLGYVERRAYASPEYLARHGRPKAPSELAKHEILGFQSGLDLSLTLSRASERATVRGKARFAANNLGSLLQLTRKGAGIGFLPKHLALPHVENGSLLPLLEGWRLGRVPVHLIHARQSFVPRRVRLLLDFLAENLREVF